MRRWILPVTLVVLTGLGATGLWFLHEGTLDDEGVPVARLRVAPAPNDERPGAPPRVALAPGAPVARAAALVPAGSAGPEAADLVAARPARPRAIELPPIVPGTRPAVREETPAALAASGAVGDLARAGSLKDRLVVLDGLVTRLPPEQALTVLGGLLEGNLPGDLYDSETLRLAILARVGALPLPGASELLRARIAPSRPRPERLVALDVLASRPEARCPDVEAIARADHDSVVQEKARWTLAQAR